MVHFVRGKVEDNVRAVPAWLLPPKKPAPLTAKGKPKCRFIKGVASL